jgi:peptide/nickel transport system permease protein
MIGYWLRRLLRSFVVILFVTALVFLLLRLSGDPAALILGQDATPERVAEVRRQLGLDQPLWIQFARYLGGMLHGDFGLSRSYGVPATDMLAQRFPNTVLLALAGTVLAIVPALFFGIVAAVKRGTKIDSALVAASTLGQAMPSFWLGIMLVLIFAVNLHWLPTSGKEAPESIVLPAITVASLYVGRFTLLLRASVIEVLQQDYIRTARSKGLAHTVVLSRHALRNALLPFVTVVGLSFGGLLGGSVITETVFAWPGVGFLAVQAVNNRDFALVQASVVVLAMCVIACNLLVDLVYPIIDPRIAARS